MGFNSKIQGYNVYSMLYFHRKFSSSITAGKCHITSVTQSQSHNRKSHDECGKIVHRPCSSCISSVQEIEENSIEFSLST